MEIEEERNREVDIGKGIEQRWRLRRREEQRSGGKRNRSREVEIK